MPTQNQNPEHAARDIASRIEIHGPSGAIFSDDAAYRYLLWRRWAVNELLIWLMLNPSTANAYVDDPTIRRCSGFAKRLGYGGIAVINLFAYRATNPKELATASDPVGSLNDAYLAAVTDHPDCSRLVMCGWGNAPIARRRVDGAIVAMGGKRRLLYCLGTTKSGAPRHPLYLRADAEMQLFGTAGG